MATDTRKFTFQLMTGNLPSTLSALAVPFKKREEIKVVAENGSRLAVVPFKISAKAKDGDTLPASFTVPVPALTLKTIDDESETFVKFVNDVLADYQDKVIKLVAEKKSTVNPTDWSALVADYNDTSRAKNGLSVAELKDWVQETFAAAFMARQLYLNETAEADGRTPADDAKMVRLAKAYTGYMDQIAGRTCTLERSTIKSVRTLLDNMVRSEHLDAEDEAFTTLKAKVDLMLKSDEEITDEAI